MAIGLHGHRPAWPSALPLCLFSLSCWISFALVDRSTKPFEEIGWHNSPYNLLRALMKTAVSPSYLLHGNRLVDLGLLLVASLKEANQSQLDTYSTVLNALGIINISLLATLKIRLPDFKQETLKAFQLLVSN